MSLPTFQQDYFLTPLVGSGHFCRVYRISDQYVAKVERSLINPLSISWEYGIPLNNLEKEYEIMKTLYENGVSVPKPEGIFEVTIRAWPTMWGKLFPRKVGLVMEYVEGISGVEIESYYEETTQGPTIGAMISSEREKAAALGFKSRDDSLDNVIYTPRTQKVTLIDFNKGWTRE